MVVRWLLRRVLPTEVLHSYLVLDETRESCARSVKAAREKYYFAREKYYYIARDSLTGPAAASDDDVRRRASGLGNVQFREGGSRADSLRVPTSSEIFGAIVAEWRSDSCPVRHLGVGRRGPDCLLEVRALAVLCLTAGRPSEYYFGRGVLASPTWLSLSWRVCGLRERCT